MVVVLLVPISNPTKGGPLKRQTIRSLSVRLAGFSEFRADCCGSHGMHILANYLLERTLASQLILLFH